MWERGVFASTICLLLSSTGPFFSARPPAAAGCQPGPLIPAGFLSEPGRRCSRRCSAGHRGGVGAELVLGPLVPSQPAALFAGAPRTRSFRRPTPPTPPLLSPWEETRKSPQFHTLFYPE